jgi:hypothetical protein
MLPITRLPEMMQPLEMIESSACRSVSLGSEDEFCRRRLRLIGAQRPLGIVQVELRD